MNTITYKEVINVLLADKVEEKMMSILFRDYTDCDQKSIMFEGSQHLA